jgi:hypothetical protein
VRDLVASDAARRDVGALRFANDLDGLQGPRRFGSRVSEKLAELEREHPSERRLERRRASLHAHRHLRLFLQLRGQRRSGAEPERD